jgi:hypothetical protein
MPTGFVVLREFDGDFSARICAGADPTVALAAKRSAAGQHTKGRESVITAENLESERMTETDPSRIGTHAPRY